MKRLVTILWLVLQVSGITALGAEPGLVHLGRHSFPVTTRSHEAQLHFDRGLNWAYSFGHFAAEQEFREALKADPDCAMAQWGIALVNGPHINFPLVPPDKAAKAWEAIASAQRLAPKVSPLERELISALAKRYANPQPEDRAPLDAAYADAMRSLWHSHPMNADVAVLFAESVMDLHPWNYWTNGIALPWTQEVVDTLETALRPDPNHPGANHFHIHILEASSNPERALVPANRLSRLVPDSSHMVHMPAHIHARVGDWKRAAQDNRDAMAADARYRSVYPRPGFYAMYMVHNAHFLAYTAMMLGRRTETLAMAGEVVKGIPPEFLAEYGAIADGFVIFRSEALMRFGLWDEILKEPVPDSQFLLARALWHFTRGVAFTALGRLEEARKEQVALAAAAGSMPADSAMGNNSATAVLAIATRMLDGELAAKEQRYDTATAVLREAVTLEDQLIYDEPPGWIQPVRHTLGAVLLKAGRAAEAEAVYREDLRINRENGWALLGLRDALKQEGKSTEASRIDARLHRAWSDADVSPAMSCYCQSPRR
jgi:tetratricopeptide (TPR) repeat protein